MLLSLTGPSTYQHRMRPVMISTEVVTKISKSCFPDHAYQLCDRPIRTGSILALREKPYCPGKT